MKRAASLFLSLLLLGPLFASAAMPVLKIDAAKIVARVSPRHAGLMTEEINHAYDGGLYAELVSNRTFEEEMSQASNLPPHWTLVQDGSAAGVIAVDDQVPLNPARPLSLRVQTLASSPGNRVGVANDGFWGIPVKPGTTYHASFEARIDGNSARGVSVEIESADGTTTYAHAEAMLSPGAWHHYEITLATAADVAVTTQARLVIATEEKGILWLSLVSLFPPTYHARVNGNRVDLMEKLAALKPAFLRFPGGNYLEGNTIAERFDWKKTLGPIAGRPGHLGPWGYRSSDGLGLLEFLQWCEDLKMEPVLGVFAGLALKGECVKPGPELEPYVQDALDEIEYITGNAATPWGARRARDGHPAPFPLTYVEIGNEDWDEKSDYDGRYAQFHDALKARYPALQLIATKRVKGRAPDVIDDHYYRSATDFFNDAHHYDAVDRTGPKIFVGEWATMEGSPTPNFHAALGDAAWMTAMERNSDLVIMQAYAPLLTNVNRGAIQWRTNLIGYDAAASFGSPSYYAQVLFNAHRGDTILDTSPGVANAFFYAVTRDSRTGTIYVKAVNAEGKDRTIRIEVAGISRMAGNGKVIVLTGKPEDTNSLQEPMKIVPVEAPLTGLSPAFDHIFPANSITVMELPAR